MRQHGLKQQISLKDLGLDVFMCSVSSRVGSTVQDRVSTRSEGVVSKPHESFQ